MSVTKETQNVFSDPEWEYILEQLVHQTQRTTLIRELTGAANNEKTFKMQINKVLQRLGLEVNRPRGTGKLDTGENLLQTKRDHFDASYLAALYFGRVRNSQINALHEVNLKRITEKLINVYTRYRKDMYNGKQNGGISFEHYVALIKGIKNNNIIIERCSSCDSQYVRNKYDFHKEKCPICENLRINLVASSDLISARLAIHREKNAGLGLRAV